MEQLKLTDKVEKYLDNFVQGLKGFYGEELVSVILYGSAASGEFVERHSNINLLVVLKNTDLDNLKKASKLISRFRMINPLFLSENYINASIDIFPIEFLDMQENSFLFYGRDVLKDINIDIRNLRFQCEQELKAKLINLRRLYLRINRDKAALRNLLLKSFTSILHISRNVLRLKGKKPAYQKSDILKELAAEFKINTAVWEKILAVRLKQIKLSGNETETLFINFVKELERIVDVVDRL